MRQNELDVAVATVRIKTVSDFVPVGILRQSDGKFDEALQKLFLKLRAENLEQGLGRRNTAAITYARFFDEGPMIRGLP